jgi:hypothetical protein
VDGGEIEHDIARVSAGDFRVKRVHVVGKLRIVAQMNHVHAI